MAEPNIVKSDSHACTPQFSNRMRQLGNIARGSMLHNFDSKPVKRERVFLGAAAEGLQESPTLAKSCGMNVHVDPEVWGQVNGFRANRCEATMIDCFFLSLSAHIVKQNLRRLEMRAPRTANQRLNTMELILAISDAEDGLKADRQLMGIEDGV
jgi:hypothetical protein